MGDRRTDISRHDVGGALAKARVRVPVTDLLKAPDDTLTPEMQLLFGEPFDIHAREGEWSFGRALNPLSGGCDYIGWVASDALNEGASEPTHRVRVLRAPIFREPDLKTRILRFLPLGARVTSTGGAVGNGGAYRELSSGGFASTRHLADLEARVEDWVDVAEAFQGLPYVWGGNGPDGMDCSGLVRMALHEGGVACLRDADQQEAALGQPVEVDPDLMTLQRGDLVFWPGHVGVMQTSGRLLHANAYHMGVATEPLREAVARIGPIRTVKRL